MGSDLSEGGVYGTIIRTSFPMMLAFFLQSVFNIVDAFFVGKISPEALAAVSVSFPIVFLLISLGAGIGSGVTSVVARLVGAKRIRQADNAAQHGMILVFLLALALSSLSLLAGPLLVGFAGAEGELKSLAMDYLNIILFFSPVMLLMMVGNSVLRGEGDMRTPMFIMGFSAVLNMFLDPIFIFTFGLGVRGAAIATVISRFFALLLFSAYILRGGSWIKLNPRDFKYTPLYVKNILSVGIPSSLSNVSMSVGMYLVTVIVGLFGPEALAAFGVGFRLDSLAILPGLGVAVAVISIVGQSLGAGKTDRAREITVRAGLMTCAAMSFIGGVFYVFAPHIIRVFNTDPIVVGYGVSFLRIIPVSYLFVGFAMCISGALIGAGRAGLALVITLFRAIVFSVPLAWFLSRSFGPSGVWMGMVAGAFLGLLISLLFFFRTDWYSRSR